MTSTKRQPALFEDTEACAEPGCPAIRLSGQTSPVTTCQFDLYHDTTLRPKRCLNRWDPSTAPLPDSY